ncbi:MAG: hypothetical protein ACREKB_12070, partial [Candidatus Rokuibacteriota bacterium]
QTSQESASGEYVMKLDTEAGFKRIPWENYVQDARNLFLAASSAGPVAMQVWTTAWCTWAMSAAKTNEQLARRWNSIIEDPSRGATVLDLMRADYKQYLLEIGGIPERAVLEFLQTMSESKGGRGDAARSASEAFVADAEEVVTAVTDAFSQIAATCEAQAAATGKSAPGYRSGLTPAPAAAAPVQLAQLQEKLSSLKTARTRLGRGFEPPAR